MVRLSIFKSLIIH